MHKKNQNRVIYKRTLLTFVILALICTAVNFAVIQNRVNLEKLLMEQLILENSYIINDVVSEQLYNTKALAALVIHGDGTVHKFHETARVLIDKETSIANFLLAPGGIVSDVYPFEENKAVMGLDLLDPSQQEGNLEAVHAFEIDDLVIAGPFMLRQGYMGLVGRYPVHIEADTGSGTFWGLVSVTLEFPRALENTGLSFLEHSGFFYELWRINPDTGDRQVIASNNELFDYNAPFVERPMEILNAEWYFRMYPINPWYTHPVTWILLFAGLSLSFMGALVVQYIIRNTENKINKFELLLLESKISIMLSQIKPHFLYNSLTVIRELCRIDPQTARETVDDFANYLRGNLDSLSISTPIAFDKELKHVKTYLSLEKKRFEERLKIEYEISVHDFLLPALSLQLIVENAVRHGITEREDGGTVTIKTEENESNIVITVTDDGVGFDINILSSQQNHVGIKNAENRLAVMCGGTLSIDSRPGVGTTVVISIPKANSFT